jgi:8-oxo-(d)GTP phosphatase
MPDHLIRAAGAVTYRPGRDRGSEPEVLLVHRTKYDDWSLPKGKQEPGEQLPVTAVREVREESGARIVLGRRLVPTRYLTDKGPKQVDYWAARVRRTDDGAVPNHEVDQVAWMQASRAAERISYARDVAVLEDFRTEPAATVPLILLRHATALPRTDFRGDDAERPLEETGRADAKTLAVLLSCFAPAAHVVSSPAVRCADTVRPYAELTGATVRPEPALGVSRTDPSGSRDLITRIVAAGEPAVCCAHRENLHALLAVVAGTLDGRDVPAADAGGSEPLPTSGFWALQMVGQRAAAIDRYDLSGILAATRPGAFARRARRTRSTIQAASRTASAISA